MPIDRASGGECACHAFVVTSRKPSRPLRYEILVWRRNMKLQICGPPTLRSLVATVSMVAVALTSASAQTSTAPGTGDQKVLVESLLMRISELERAQKQ